MYEYHKTERRVRLPTEVDVLEAEGGRLTTRGHDRVELVDTVLRDEGTVCEVGLDEALGLHPPDCGTVEVLDLACRALGSTSEILRNKIGINNVYFK